MLPQVKNVGKISNDFKKQDLKWKIISSMSYIEKIIIFLWKFRNFHKKKVFSTSVFFQNSVLGQHMCSISTNEVSWKFLLHTNYFHQQKYLNSKKKIWWKRKKIWKMLGLMGTYVQIYINFKIYYVSVKTKT